MPSRGPYWKEGGIPDFTIQLSDLTQELQDQITGGGGGGATVVGSDDVTTPKTDLTATISPTIALGSIQELLIVANFDVASNATVKVQLSGLALNDYRDLGKTFNSSGESTTFGAGTIDGWTTGLQYFAGFTSYIRIQVSGQQFGGRGPDAIIHAYSQGSTAVISYGGGDIFNTSVTNFSEVKILANQNFTAGSTLRVYKVNRS